MCLITEQKEPIILKEDLIVYKVLRPDLESPMQYFNYILGRFYEFGIMPSKNPMWPDSVASEYYGKDNIQTKSPYNTITKGLYAYGEGLHFITSKERAYVYTEGIYGQMVIVKCLIPAGAEVYYDKTGLGVTNKLKVIEVL